MNNHTDGKIRRRSEVTPPNEPSSVNDSFQSFDTTDGRDGLYRFLHKDLRISREVASFYCTSLTENGYDDVSSLQDATENDLRELGVKLGHVRRIARAVKLNHLRDEAERKREKERDRSPCKTGRGSDSYLISPEIAEEGMFGHQSLEGSLLSEYALQEVRSREEHFDIDHAKELLIRKQAEKIASLETKLAHVDLNQGHNHSSNDNGDGDELRSSTSRGGSADTNSKKLTPEERLQLHLERKMEENKYKEKVGKWGPPPSKKEKRSTKKVAENDELVLKLTSDPTRRKKIDEIERSSKKSSRKSMTGEGANRDRSPGNKLLSPTSSSVDNSRHNSSNKMINVEERKQKDSGRRNNVSPDSGYNQMQQSASHSSRDSFESSSDRYLAKQKEERQKSIPSISCETCGSTRDCEEDVDNPGIFYCKFCWDEYECSCVDEDNISQRRQQVAPASSDLIDSNDADVHHALWIVHDNPRLGEKIVYSGPGRMECMIETREPGKKNCVRIIVGDIDFNGKAENSGIGNLEGSENDLGTECIRIRNAKGYLIDHDQVDTKLSRDKSTYEFQLRVENALLLTGKNASQTVEEFFKDCNGAIDVILDPQKDTGGWYPQKEACEGGRKIAPQFRSKGVGYIRLGDDMGENGLAFLSSNACLSFLSSVSGSSRKSSSAKTSEPKKKGQSNTSSIVAKKKHSLRKPQPSVECSSDASDDESEDEVPNVSQVLKKLQSADVASNTKWKEKADLISQLGKAASRPDGRDSRPHALNILQDTLGGKNVNVNVTRQALIAVGIIGLSMGGDLVSQISWKTIMIEMMKLLKSKQCGSVSKTVLGQLHGKCFTLSNSLEFISHVLGLGSTASANAGKKSRKSIGAVESSQPRKTSPNGGNSVEVIEWLAVSTERERTMELINPMLEKSSLNMLVNLFQSHADHRDQRCRKNALDGLMHCVLYGVQHLGLDLPRGMNMFSSMKESNPKAWNQIYQSAQMILEGENR